MQINDRYMNTFKLTFANNAALFALAATEIPLSGFEKGGDPCISTDIPHEDERASQLDIIYRDTNPDDAMHYELVGDEAEAKRQTFVIPRRDGNDIDTVGYLFKGLLHVEDARLWYRHKWGYEQVEPVVPVVESRAIPPHLVNIDPLALTQETPVVIDHDEDEYPSEDSNEPQI